MIKGLIKELHTHTHTPYLFEGQIRLKVNRCMIDRWILGDQREGLKPCTSHSL